MKNKEKYANEIIELALRNKSLAMNNKTRKLCDCADVDCSSCFFDDKNYIKPQKGGCLANTNHWANSEYVEPKEFTKQEKALIRPLDNIEWIARDRDGILYGYIQKPEKRDFKWSGIAHIDITHSSSCEFKAIKWEDTEPTSREEILREGKRPRKKN